MRPRGQLVEEAAGLHQDAGAVLLLVHQRVAEVQLVASAGHAHVEEPALLLFAALVLERRGAGETPVGKPHQEDRAPLEALRLVDAGEHQPLVGIRNALLQGPIEGVGLAFAGIEHFVEPSESAAAI